MTKKVQVMVLKPASNGGCAPDPEEWLPRKNKRIAILNASGALQELFNISANMLVHANGDPVVDKIVIDKGGFWYGEAVGKGDYWYSGGESATPRMGTIDPS